MTSLRSSLLSLVPSVGWTALSSVGPTVVVVGMLACVLLPLPTVLVDLLLSVSLAGSVSLLVASLVVRRSTDLITFPSLLLLVTLYRLALNISTTRLILSQADAGQVIASFSGIVVRDDLVVGGVMFLIITVIQFVVIARGAERIAEVGARFALDGLPGHQMAIDSDLRAGAISPREAARRRTALIERSNFHGAMDGAVRFVRGDAIAGVSIIVVNLVGGLVIGVGRYGMSWRQSLDVYGRLTIGDGLMSQLPALLVSLAAGILVSRVDSGEVAPRVRRWLPSWLEPAMLLVPALLLLGLAMVPTMPRIPFAATAVALLSVSMVLTVRVSRVEARSRLGTPAAPRIVVRVSPSMVRDARVLERALAEVRERCAAALAFDVPPIELVPDPERTRQTIEVRVSGRRCGETELSSARDVDDQIVLASFRLVMDNATTLVDLQRLDGMVERIRATHPVVARRALEVVDLPDLLAIVRAFLRERVPLPPLPSILGVLAEQRPAATRQPQAWIGLVRERLAQEWVRDVFDAMTRLGEVRFVRLTPDAEDALLARSTLGDEVRVSLSDAERSGWLDRLRELVAPNPAVTPAGADASPLAPGHAPVILVASPSARAIAASVFAEFTPHVPVMSTAELAVARLDYRSVWRSVWLDAPDPS